MRFYEYLTDKLIKSSKVNDPIASYLYKPGEAATNLLEIGKNMGIKPGQNYPGNKIFKNMINKYK